MLKLRIMTVAGSLRKGSYNRMLIELAEGFLEQTDAEIDRVDLRDFPMPPYDGDAESATGLPQEVWTLKARIAASHGILISAPEYNRGMSGMFKNVIDWTSRGGSNPWNGKVVALMGTTDGPWGTWAAMPQYRQTFMALFAIVLPQPMNVPFAKKVWNEDGELIDQALPPKVEKYVKQFLELAGKLKGQ